MTEDEKERGRPHGGLPTTSVEAHRLPLPAAALSSLDDALSRVGVVREALEDGDYLYAASVAENLEHDLAGTLHLLRDAA